MFNLFKSAKNNLTSLKSSVSKVASPLMDLEALNQSKEQIEVRDEDRYEKANNLYNEALELLESFNLSKNDNEAYKAAEKLYESLKYKRNGEVYFWLSYIYYVFDKDKLTFQYLKIAEDLSPEYNKIKEFKKIIGEN